MKGKKKQWNKSESAQTVQEYLIDEAEQIGQQARPDDALFFIDTGADSKIKKRAERQEVKDSKKNSSLVEAAIVDKLLKKRKWGSGEGGVKAKTSGDAYDLWGESEKKEREEKEKVNPYVEPVLKKPRTFKVTPSLNDSKLKALEKLTAPSSGISYMPSFEAHQDALASALAVEIEWKDKRAAEVARPVMEPHYVVAEEELLKLERDDDEGDDELDETNTSNKKLSKKDKAKRNKEQRAKLLEVELEKARRNKKLLNQIERADEVSRDIAREANRKVELLRQKNKIIAVTEQSTLPRRIVNGKAIEEIPKLSVNLTEDLSGSLRTLKPLKSGKMIMEHLESLHRQNKIEVNTIRRIPKSGKKKEHNLQKVPTIKELEAAAL